MKKMIYVKKTKNDKPFVATKICEHKPLQVVDLRTCSAEYLYNCEEQVVMRMSGLYGNFEKAEITNIYGVKFHHLKNIF